ncbi:MAG: OB-fold-containig protein [Pseudomonadota bacterium]|uniref:OB-fold-containig protein n=1 Tax=Alteromonas oceani TaxID=2071609 RepID=A0ABV7K789_9ALTE|nr:OB-fold-containig protein [Alteromonas oceani]MEC9261732.1 OB-fold-containig protein [Pseudomonadota bacterium]
MLSFLLDDANFWFSCALGIVIALFILEMAGMFFGVSLLGLVDDQAALDADTDTSSGFTEFGSWLALDRLPLLVWLVLLLTTFGSAGLTFNFLSLTLLDTYFARWLITLLAVIAGLFFTARFGTFIARLLPKQESSATTADELIGTVGHITVGVARQNSPAEGKFIDAHGQPHYLLVEPLEPDEQFSQGEKILLIQKRDYRWLASRYSDL